MTPVFERQPLTPRTRDKWLSFIRQFQRSPLSLRQFALSQGLNYSTFRNYYYRLRQLVTESPPEAELQFLPVLVEDTSPSSQPSEAVRVTLPGDMGLAFPQLPPPQYLAQLVHELEGR